MTGYLHNSLVLIVALVAAICVFIILGVIWDQVRLAGHRGVPRHEFIEEFSRIEVPSEISSAVYDYYKSLSISKNFGVSPDTSYERVLHMVHDDIDDDAELLVKTLNMEMPIEPILQEWTTEIKSLRDMVLWLDWI